MVPNTIEEVLAELDTIIDESVQKNSYLAIFAYVYRRTTAQIRQAVIDKQFEEGERMKKMDVRFANKYIDAYRKFNASQECSKSWSIAFKAGNENLAIIQHLLIGMNAHINLDLGVAASEIAPGNEINGLKNDFMKVNDILASLTAEMAGRISRVSWWMFLLDWIGGKTDDAMVNFSIKKAREEAWEFACSLAASDETGKKQKTEDVDDIISKLSEIIRHPPGILLRTVLKFISYFEEKDVKIIIEKLEK